VADRRGIARVSIRVVGGVIGVGVAALVIAGATALPLPSASISAPVSTVRPVPADLQRVCPGPLLSLASDAGTATDAAPFGSPSTTYGTNGPAAETRRLKPGSSSASRSEAPLTLSVATPSGATSPPQLAGAQSQDASTDDLTGLAVASCDEAAADTWLVAGSASLGQTSLVLLSNPSSVPATVRLTISAESGLIDAPGASGIQVPAGSQKVVPLAGLAPSVASPVIHVQSTGGQVLASLQQSYEQGIDPRGAEITGATASPSRTQVISGMTISSLDAVKSAQSGEGYGTDLPAVRVLVPGEQDATVTVGAVGESGTDSGNSYSAEVKAGVVTEIPLDGLKDGNFTVTVNSSVPIVAAARTSVNNDDKRDFAWFVASQPLGSTSLAAIPSGPSPLMHFANIGEKKRTVTVTAKDGTKQSVTVPVEGSANLSVSAGMVTLKGSTDLVASVSFGADAKSSTFALNPPGPLAAPLKVYPR
jgi:hypothetical protein